jgi:hypothetical protein
VDRQAEVTDRTALRAIKLAHTAAWALFAGCIVALPYHAWRRRFDVAFVLIGVVMIEVAILAANRMRCPLTAVAARYTADRQDNFDIYLPLWVARYNKQIFGTLFAIDVLWTVAAWWSRAT